MPVPRDGGGKGRPAPPVPESPLWLPAVSQVCAEAGRLGAAAASGTLPRVKDLRASSTSPLPRDSRQLFDPNLLAQQQLPLPPGRAYGSGAHGHVSPPRLPLIHARPGAPPSGDEWSNGTVKAHMKVTATVSAPEESLHAVSMQHQQTQQRLSASPSPSQLASKAVDAPASRAPPSLQPAGRRSASPRNAGACGFAPVASHRFDPDRVPGVETGPDAVAFFGRYGQETPVKFFYCNRPPEEARFRPYDLVVVSREEVHDEYVTVSATGVVRIRKGVQAEFTPLSEWVREAAMFDAISTIGFFRNYLTGRTFRAWVKVVRRKNFQKVRAAVAARLLAAKANFLPALTEIWGHVADLRAISFCSANPNHIYTLQEYAEQQQATRDTRAKPAVEAIVERVQRALERVCRDVQQQAALYQESVRDASELADTTGVELGQGRAGAGRVRPMVVVKQEKIERAANYARIMEELSLLGNFVRLADYLLVAGVMGRALAATEDTLSLLTSGRAAGVTTNKGVFTTTVSFAPGGATLFAPDGPAIMDEINVNTIEGALALAQAAPRVLFMRAFAHLSEARPSSLNPLAVLRASPELAAARQRINEAVATDFLSARDAARVLDDYRKIWEFGRSWDGDAYAAHPRELGEIRRDLVVQRSWKSLLERMKTGLVVGCLQVDAKPLKAELVPITQAAQERIKLVLLSLARDATLAALEDIQGRNALLAARPATLDGYMGYLTMHMQQVEDRKQLVAICGQIDDMYDSLAAHEQKVPTAEQVKHDDLTEALATFQQQLAEGKEWLADTKAEQVSALQAAVADVNHQLEDMVTSLHSGTYVDADADPEEVVADLEAMLQRLGGLGDALATYKQYLGLVDQPPDDGSALVVAEKEASARYQLWLSLRDFMAASASWTEEAVLDDDGRLLLEIESIRAEVDEYASKAYKAAKSHKDDPVAARLNEVVEDFKEIMPLVEELANPALKLRHWQNTFELIGADVEPNESGTGYAAFSIRYLLQFDLLDNLEKLQAIGSQASKEASLDKALAKMKADWQGMAFRVVPYKDTGTYVIGGTDDVQALLDDHIVKAQTMRSSPFLKPLEAEAIEWENLLHRAQDLLDNWLSCQATWQYLEPIFSSPDILAQMPEEGDKFQQVDATWRGVMGAAHVTPSVLSLAADPERLAALEEANQLLEQIQKGLAAYLELKRLAFPRFFFLSNDEMLEILSETKDPTRVQPHLKKCFEGIERLRFEPNGDISGMVSIEGEVVPLVTRVRPAAANGAVEKWLVQVEAGMVESMRHVISQGLAAYPECKRGDWVLQWPGQVVLAVTAIFWTQGVASAIADGGADPQTLHDCAKRCGNQLNEVVELVRGELSALNRATLSALVVMDVHARDVAAALAEEEGVAGQPGAFSWTSQLRHYWEPSGAPAGEGGAFGGAGAAPARRASVAGPVSAEPPGGGRTVMLRMMNASVEYGCEYLGNSMRLVVTPLTDRCYRTLIGAIHLNMGGAPEGPAGTGKTETTKDLAKALARQCVVFNCSDTLDYTTMGKFFKGLASTGAWACFDEFNRIDLEVLSVVAQQVSEIQAAVRAKLRSFVFEGTELQLRPSCNVFITMNPGYAGRSELPDNLKALFRTVAMMVPEYAMIAEIMLYSSGYNTARECARKIVATYRLCSEQLSSQDHYDYGMRAVMAVLRAAGNLKRRFPSEDESALMLRAILDVNLCKFLAHDVPLFNGILGDLFPGVALPPPDYGALHAALGRQCAARNLQATEYFKLKATQLYEMVVVRHGLMLVGGALSGKTCALQCLASALGELKSSGVAGPLYETVQVRTINPKAVTMGELYGEADKATQEWKDGVLAVAFRALASDPSPDRKWLVLDGPVDALWIENMNTVLDDNKKLCLPNSEIITMSPTMSMIFEVGDLAVASPATVSRCGMVYLEPHQLGWRPLMTSWLQTLPKALGSKARRLLESLFDWLMPACLRFVRKRVRESSTTQDAGLARAAMRIVGALVGAKHASVAEGSSRGGAGGALGADDEGAEDGVFGMASGGAKGAAAALQTMDDAAKARLCEAALLFGMVWGVGGSADADGRKEFDAFFRLLVAGGVPPGFEELVPSKAPGLGYAPSMPDEGSVYDFVWDPKASAAASRGVGCWVPWSRVTPALSIQQGSSFSDIIVPTIDTARYTHLLDLALRQGYPLLLVGATGTGKTTIVTRHLLGRGHRDADAAAGAAANGKGAASASDEAAAAPGGDGGSDGPGGGDEKSAAPQRMVGGLAPECWVPIFLNLSARTTANMVQEQVDGRLDKRKKGVFGPPIGRKAIVFVDDLNMPAKETFGAQPPLELLRQALAQGGWFSRDNTWHAMTDIQWAAAMGPSGGGRSCVSSRVLRHFSVLACAQASDETLLHIFGSILSWHLSQPGFPTYLVSLAGPLVTATLNVYSAAAAKLLPTPAKSHYLFNLRDFARVVQGIMMLPPSELPKASIPQTPAAAADPGPGASAGAFAASAPPPSTPAARVLKRLWLHETLRVFYDRLVDAADRDWLLGQLRGSCRESLGEEMDTMLQHLVPGGQGQVGQEELRRLFFGDYVNPAAEPSQRSYAELPDASRAVSAVEEGLLDLNATSKRPLPLAVFLFAVEHVSRVCRVLKQPGGNMLLVGVGGSGRQSVARLAAHISGLEVFQIEVGKSYGRAEWREDLKTCCRRAGAEGKRLVFLLSDGQLKEEAWLEDINNLLNTGEVPNMYPADEKMQILEAVRPLAARIGLETPLELWGFFVSRCRANLHLLLALSPAGAAFRERLRASPSLVNCCTIDWFWQWPSDALEAVALKELRQLDMDAGTRRKLVGICQAVHNQVSDASPEFLAATGHHNYVTPSSYLELLSTFRTLLEAARADNTSQRRRYTVGLEKLAGSAQQVEGMQAELVALQPQLVKTVAEVEALMERIAHDKKHEVEPKAAVVQEEEARARAAADAAKAIKDECEADLAEAIPILNEALAALDTIKEADIAYMRKLANPPVAIKLVLEAVCVVLDVKPGKIKDETGKEMKDYWKPSVALLNDREFLQKLKTYDKDNIPPRIVSSIRATYIPDEGFTPEVAKRASPAAEGLCKWVHAMSAYDKVAKVVTPKRAKLAEANATYEGVVAGLREKQAELQALLDRLAGMEAELKANTEKKERLEGEIELCSIKLTRAAALIGGLGGERTRWQETAAALARAQECLVGDMLTAASVIAYLGAFTAPWRAKLVQGILGLCTAKAVAVSPGFSLASALGNPLRTREWLIAGLPNDAFSIENAIIVSKARRWPLMIDPQGQANKWVRNLERPKNLQVIKPGHGTDFMRVLENAVQFGQPVLLENVGEELDPSLEPLLAKQVFKQGGVMCIRLGDAAVEYSPDFLLYITTKLRNPHYLPELAVKVTLLNFKITPAGLSDQLLGVLVAAERPDLEEQKAALVVSGAENKRQLQEIEDGILQVLSSSQGNILEDEKAVGVITAAKALGNEVAVKQQQAEETEAAIDAARLAYAPAGDRASTLFFCISDLASVDPMYQYSLSWFTGLLLGAARDAERPVDDVALRLEAVQRQFTISLYRNLCRSLFEKDKLLFALLLAARLMAASGDLDPAEWEFFLTGGKGQPYGDAPNAAPSWLPDRTWRQLRLLSALPAFTGLDAAVSAAPGAWRAVYSSQEPHRAPLPGLFATLDEFKRMCVLRCLRPDKVLPAAQVLVEAKLGRSFVEPPPFDLAACYADSGPATPLVFVLSPGSDPAAALAQFAGERGMSGRMTGISLGQGQGAKAAAIIADAVVSGAWVVLQNCHLAPSWMPQLDKICEDLSPESTNPSFRLWMTSYPSPQFPVNILQNAVKMTNEPPQGLRANIRRSLNQEPLSADEFFEGCRRPSEFKRLAFGLVFFHALVQERRRFGPLGWNIPYGFDDGDQRISLRQLRMYLDESQGPVAGQGGPLSGGIPFAALRYVIGECNYGGRVTDNKDRLLLSTLLERCLCPPLVDSPQDYALLGAPPLSPHSAAPPAAAGGGGGGGYTYRCPVPDGPRGHYLAAVDAMPLLQEPSAFGLHANANIAKDISATESMLSSLLQAGSGSAGAGAGGGSRGGEPAGGTGGAGGGGGVKAEEARLAALVADCLAALPAAPFDLEAIGERFPVRYEESMNTVLVQEMARFNRLTAVLRDSLEAMQKALAGLTVMSSELEAAARSIALNQVPELWRRVSYPSLKPLASYVSDLSQRLAALGGWAAAGRPPPSFCLPFFFFPHSFLTAGLQNYARRRRVPIDVVAYDFEPLSPREGRGSSNSSGGGDGGGGGGGGGSALPTEPPPEGVYVHGLWLEGASWDAASGRLAECEPKVLYAPAPVIWFRPMAAGEIREEGRYSCPMYRTAERRGVLATTGHSTNFVTLVRLPTEREPAHWVMRGAALLTQLSE